MYEIYNKRVKYRIQIGNNIILDTKLMIILIIKLMKYYYIYILDIL